MLQFQILLTPLIILLGLAFLFNVALRKFHDTNHEQVAFGLLFGTIVTIGMTHPLTLGEGLIFDTRTLMVGAAVAFVGPLAGTMTLAAGLICRLMIGGAGTGPGVAGLLLAFGLAVAWCVLMRGRIKSCIVNDALLGLAITPSASVFFMLPYELAIELLASILPTLLTANVLGMVAIGLVFRRERKHLEYTKTLTAFAQTDALTNLLNRRGMDARVGATTFDTNLGHALFYFDVDDFKQVNDTHGHSAGDAALAIVAARIKDSIRVEAVFSRHGGDEFSIYMPRLDAADVRAVAERLGACVSDQAFVYSDMTFNVSISIGAFWTKRAMPIQEMIDKADTQLLLAKQAGKNRAQVAYDGRDQGLAVA